MTHLRRKLIVAGNGMVGHRFVQAAIERGLTESYDVLVLGDEPRPAYDRVALTSFFEVERRRAVPAARGFLADPRVELRLTTAVDGIDRDARRSRSATASSRSTTCWCSPPVPARSCHPSRPRPGRLLRLPHDRGPGGDPRGVADGHGRCRDRRWPARARGGQRAAPARPGDPRRGDGSAADAGAARRRRGSGAPPSHREPRRQGAHRGQDRGVLDEADGNRVSTSKTVDRRRVSSSSPPASGRVTTSARGRARPRRARRSPRRRALPHQRRAHLRDRRVRGAGRADVRPGRARLLDGRGGRRPPARR